MALRDHLPALEALRRAGKTNAGAALATLEDVIARGDAIATALGDYQAGAALRIAVPFAEVLALVDVLETFAATYYPDLDYPAELFDAVRHAQHWLVSLETVRRAFASQAGLTAADGTRLDPRGLIPYRLRQGDTLERLALTYLGRVERLWEIIDLNGLGYPFLVTDRGLVPGAPPQPDRTGVGADVRVTGETIFLPSDAVVAAGESAFTPDDVELFGRDIEFTEDGVLRLSPDGDLVAVGGVDNLVQALRTAVGTVQGELVLHPDYGVERLLTVGVEGTRANTIMAGMEVARSVLRDPRVVAVRDIGLSFDDTVARAGMRVEVIGPGQRDLPLNLIVPEIVGGSA
jgi:phage baseplate assembly protein W